MLQPSMRALLALLVPLLVLAFSPTGAAVAANAVYATTSGALLADFSYEGPCIGTGTATLVVHAPGGDQTLTAAVTSSSPTGGACGAGLRCLDCPPVPTAFAWELKGNGVLLVGGGPAVYEQYSDHAVAYALQGTFLGGALAAHGTIKLT